ncbi:hypothetical protein DFJ63DRAFT_311899 [Scheffersomyces coipomensis]|uniref:uncharacterized protein n=1 Tax=Scheffersomyces coipomensis TaxID=1788519 RepID=UPI00315D8536
MTQLDPEPHRLDLNRRISTDISKIRKSIKSLSKEDVDDLLNHIRLLVDQSPGIEDKDVIELVDILMNTNNDKGLLSSQKRYVFDYLLIPSKTCLLPSSIIYKALANLGVSKTSSKKQTQLPQSLQLQLLQWIIKFINNFGKDVYHELNRMLPIIFNYLSYEYLRPYIASLICMTLIKYSSSTKTYYNKTIYRKSTPIKRWYIDTVIDLYYRFPTDEYIKGLLSVFKQVDRSLDYSDYDSNISRDINNLSNSSFVYSIEANPGITVHSNKRRKINGSDIDIYSGDFLSNNRIEDIKSVDNLIENLHNIKYIDIDTQILESDNASYGRLFILLHSLLDSDSMPLKKLDYSTSLNLSNNNSPKIEIQKVIAGIREFIDFCPSLISLPAVKQVIMKGLGNSYTIPTELLSFVSVDGSTSVKEDIIVPLFDSCQMKDVLEVTFYVVQLLKYTSRKVNKESNDVQRRFYTNFNISIIYMIEYLHELPLTLTSLFAVNYIISCIKAIPMDILNEFFEDSCIILPPKLVYSMILYGDPYIFSEICGYIAFTKNYEFKNDSYKLLQNCYIMDLVNLVWRDKAFSYDVSATSPNKALLLNAKLIDGFSSLPLFASFNINSIGGIYFNSAWSYISAQIVWKFEDSDSRVTTRHEGPVRPESVANLVEDNDLNWLPFGYDELKLKTLNEFDNLGFTGVCDLLFNSLKTLMQHRQISQQN